MPLLEKIYQDKNPEGKLSEVKISSLLEKEFRIMIVKMIKKLRKIMDAQSEKLEVFNKELENLKNNQTEMKNTLEGLRCNMIS